MSTIIDQSRALSVAAHTPTPFLHGHAYYRGGAGGFAVPFFTGNNVSFTIIAPDRDRLERDAAFIVRACNSHAALVEALEKTQLAFMNVARFARFESKASLEAVAQLRHCEERNRVALQLAKKPAA